MPIREITNTNVPNSVVKNETFNPPANILDDTDSIDSIASKAEIIPIIEPRNPNTKPNKLE